MPAGPPIPDAGDHAGATSGQARIGYYLATREYRFQGEYSLTFTVTSVGPTALYVFGDVDVEASSSVRNRFQPERQTGTFELGAQHAGGIQPLTLFLRHQSPHNIDRADRRQGSWEMLGARWKHGIGGTQFTFSGGAYVHRIVNDYTADFLAEAITPLGVALGKRWELKTRLHQVLETHGGFTDFWIEPEAVLTPRVRAFIGAGQIHNIDVFGGRTDTPVTTGIRILW